MAQADADANLEEKEKWSAVRVARLEVMNADRESRERWMQLRDDCQMIVNTIWQEWLLWHYQNGSMRKLKLFLNDWKTWKRAADARSKLTPAERKATPKPVKPKCDVVAVTKECRTAIYERLKDDFPEVNIRVVSLIMQKVENGIRTRGSAKGNIKGWMAILLCREGMPSSTRGIPIPFDVKNAKLRPPDDDQQNYTLEVRVDRIPARSGNAKSTLDVLELMSKGRKVSGQIDIIKRCIDGSYKFCGSSLHFDRKTKKWFALICWQKPAGSQAALDPNKMAYLKPCRQWPWKLRLHRNRRPGGLGQHVGVVRKQVFLQRAQRKSNYRYAGSANKGHGRERAYRPMAKLSQRWKDFTKTYNHTVTTDVVDQCVANGFGTLVYFQPADNVRTTRFLAASGQLDQVRDASGWDWFQVASQLKYKCEAAGIELIVKKFGEGKKISKAAA